MLKSHTYGLWAAAALLTVSFLSPAAFASYAVPSENMVSGVIQDVNYVDNTVKVNGHVYKISPKAAYMSDNVKNIGGLQAGMKIQFIANGPVSDRKSQVTNIVLLPPTSP
ncbi:MAG TPA: hypothetical protein VNI53_06035 [Gammaproteobacteria bacterium]|nr:hypothetical protein [Gammaproteobacteria bacterium]